MLRVWAFACGWLTAPLAAFLEGAEGLLRVPVPSYLIEHPRGRLVFDTGLHPDTQVDPEARLGAAARTYRVEYASGEELAGRLARLDVDASKIPLLVNSHLHFDHSGGNAQLPNARLLVQRREWEAAQDPDLQAANYFRPQDYDLGQPLELVDGEHDIFGDGSVVCLPTYGHTPGHQSLRLRGASGSDLVITADACYLRQALDELKLPPVAFDRDAMLESMRGLRRLRDAGAQLLYGHDPELWASLPAFPKRLV